MERNKRYLIVYNTCGISGKDNSQYYVDAIKTINNQNFTNYKLAVSSCKNSDEQIQKILDNCRIDFVNKIDDILPVNITFNDTVRECIKQFGEFEAYLYLDSGIKFTNENQLSDLIDTYESDNCGMVSSQVDNDFGWCWFGLNEYSKPVLAQDVLVPIGRACNLHCQLFSKEIFEYYGNVIPDIFRSYCTESVFSFINAALKKRWIISSKVRVHHAFNVPGGSPNDGDGLDGHSSGFRAPHGTWDDVYPPHTMKEIVELEEGTQYGFGYEELRGIKLHNQECFDENFYCTNDDLKLFLKKYLYRKKSDFDYEKINKRTIVV
tara:strand:+ start:2101 stop:3063 length:963 start_codon:yes stop_codon:yes gene_type:complete